MDPSMFMALAMGTQGIANFGNAYSQSQALSAQSAYQKQVYNQNASLAGMQADDAIQRGNLEAGKVRKRTNKMIGDQRASFGAQGIDPASGSAANIENETSAMGELDALTAKNNAWREAWGYKVQANQYTNQGSFAELAADNQSRNTLLTGGMQALGYGAQAAYYAKKG